MDGRAGVFMPQPPRLREKLLSRMFRRALKSKKIDMENLEVGRYHFNYTEVRLLHVEAELTPAE